MSNTLKLLRELFDDPLFVRHARGITPTARALALGPALNDALARLGAVLDPPTFDPKTAARTFVVATSDYVDLVLLAPLLGALAKAAPSIRVELRSWGRHEVPEALARAEVDLAIGYFDAIPPGHHGKRLFEERFVCIVRKNHPRVRSRLSRATWLSIPHVVVSERGSPTSIDRALAKLGLTREVSVRVSHFLLVPPLIRATDLVAAVDERVALQFAGPLGLRVLPLPLEMPPSRVGMVWHERVAADPASQWFRQTIAAVAKSV
jgi:DNA-binding transcriptional LysR family regulator